MLARRWTSFPKTDQYVDIQIEDRLVPEKIRLIDKMSGSTPSAVMASLVDLALSMVVLGASESYIVCPMADIDSIETGLLGMFVASLAEDKG